MRRSSSCLEPQLDEVGGPLGDPLLGQRPGLLAVAARRCASTTCAGQRGRVQVDLLVPGAEPEQRSDLGLRRDLVAEQQRRLRDGRDLDLQVALGATPLLGLGGRRPRSARRRGAAGRSRPAWPAGRPAGRRPRPSAAYWSPRSRIWAVLSSSSRSSTRCTARSRGTAVTKEPPLRPRRVSIRPAARIACSASRTVTVETPSSRPSSASPGSWCSGGISPSTMASVSRRSTCSARESGSRGVKTAAAAPPYIRMATTTSCQRVLTLKTDSICFIPRRRSPGREHHAGRPPARGGQDLRPGDGRRRHRPGRRARRVLLHARPVRLRQDHGAADDRRVRGPHLRPGGARRRGRHRPGAPRTRRQHRLPGLRAVPPHGRPRQRRVRPPGQAGPARRPTPARPGGARDGAAERLRRTQSRASSPGASGSGSRWRAPWSTSPRSCSSTSRSAPSTSSCAARCS